MQIWWIIITGHLFKNEEKQDLVTMSAIFSFVISIRYLSTFIYEVHTILKTGHQKQLVGNKKRNILVIFIVY